MKNAKNIETIYNKYNGNNNFSKKNRANFEQRDYADFEFTISPPYSQTCLTSMLDK